MVTPAMSLMNDIGPMNIGAVRGGVVEDLGKREGVEQQRTVRVLGTVRSSSASRRGRW
jgi:hypothetical protein